MKNRTTFTLILLTCGLWGCYTPHYLTEYEKVGEQPYGSYLKVQNHHGPLIKGELLAVQNDRLLILVQDELIHTVESVPFDQIASFDLRYARSKNYWWTLPVFTGSTILHGIFLVVTAPLNLIITTLISIDSEQAFVLTERDLNVYQLWMFARFPQGIPPGIEVQRLTN